MTKNELSVTKEMNDALGQNESQGHTAVLVAIDGEMNCLYDGVLIFGFGGGARVFIADHNIILSRYIAECGLSGPNEQAHMLKI